MWEAPCACECDGGNPLRSEAGRQDSLVHGKVSNTVSQRARVHAT